MTKAFFLTGTDTEVGKTHATCALLQRARHSGLIAAGLKPVAAGTDAQGNNDDVLRIRAASNCPLADEIVNPYCFAPAIAPHIAAAEASVVIDFTRIATCLQTAQQQADFIVVEGAGGFCVPFTVDRNAADLAVQLALPVILVVGMRLGCISHALLTAEAIHHRGLRLAGWIANSIDPSMARFSDNLTTLSELLPAPCLGVLPYDPQACSEAAAAFLQLPG